MTDSKCNTCELFAEEKEKNKNTHNFYFKLLYYNKKKIDIYIVEEKIIY